MNSLTVELSRLRTERHSFPLSLTLSQSWKKNTWCYLNKWAHENLHRVELFFFPRTWRRAPPAMLAQLPDNDNNDDDDEEEEEEEDSFTQSKKGRGHSRIWIFEFSLDKTCELRIEKMRSPAKPALCSQIFFHLSTLWKFHVFFSHEQSPLWYIELRCHENLNIIKVYVALLYFVF